MRHSRSLQVAAAIAFSTHLHSTPARATDEVHWTMTGPTSVTLDWRGANGSLRYGRTSLYDSSATAVAPTPLPFSSSGPFWEARLTRLLPNTIYHYSIADGPDHIFRTMPPAGASFVVYVEGDIGDTTSYSRVGPVQSLIAHAGPTFVLVVGDLTYGNSNGQTCVDNHFINVMDWATDAAYMPAWGNHEWDSSGDNLENYKGRFDLLNPQTSPGAPSLGCCGEDWSWFDCGGVRFISYAEPYTDASWSDWNAKARTLMDAAQADRSIHFIVTYGHRPAYSSGYHPGDATLEGYIDALGTSHSKYVLNLNGHSHDYERTYPQHGVIHVPVGTGGATLEEKSGSCPYAGGCPPPSWSAFRAFHHGALRLSISPSSILGSMMCGPAGDSGANKNDITCSLGSVFDSFQINAPATLGAPPDEQVARGPIVENVVPNPVAGSARIFYSLSGWAPVRLALLDVTGRRVLARDLGSPGPGLHDVSLDPSGRLAAGVYWLHLSQDGNDASRRLVIIR